MGRLGPGPPQGAGAGSPGIRGEMMPALNSKHVRSSVIGLVSFVLLCSWERGEERKDEVGRGGEGRGES